ncbi:MAG: hypothetical protein IJS53_02840, partial [Clostridia bacterium]|nr:hypothetical protein [Clostridia bacterium]
MNTFRVIVILLLTAVVLLAICAPALLAGVLPPELVNAASLEEFPLLGTCSSVAQGLIAAIRGGQNVTAEIVTNALGDSFFDELLSLLMVAVLTIPISLALGTLLYKPLYQGALAKGLLYVSLNLCSVMIAWVIYRKVYFRLLIEELIQKNITDLTLQTIVNYATQLFSVAAIGLVVVRLILALAAA